MYREIEPMNFAINDYYLVTRGKSCKSFALIKNELIPLANRQPTVDYLANGYASLTVVFKFNHRIIGISH